MKKSFDGTTSGEAGHTLFYYGDRYLKKSSWKDLAMVKFCLFSMGVLAGMKIPRRDRKCAAAVAGVVFAVTYIPLMTKFFAIVREKEE